MKAEGEVIHRFNWPVILVWVVLLVMIASFWWGISQLISVF